MHLTKGFVSTSTPYAEVDTSDQKVFSNDHPDILLLKSFLKCKMF